MGRIKHVDEIIADSFGLWITSLFYAIKSWNPALSFEEHKEAFFWMVQTLLEEARIKFIAPGADCYILPQHPHPRLTIQDSEAHWRDSAASIICFLRERWPSNARDENDIDLNIYFYSIPAVIWIGDDGTLVAS